MVERAAVFEQTYKEYLAQVARLDLTALEGVLGFEMDQDQALVPMLNRVMRVGPHGITDDAGRKPDLSVCVVLCKYLLMAPPSPPASEALKTFKDFQDAAPLIHFFAQNVEGHIVRTFSGRLADLEAACRDMGAEPYEADLAYQVKYRFQSLPRLPLWLLFNDAEEGFTAQCTLLFESRAQHYLDMESLAMLTGHLAYRLERSAS